MEKKIENYILLVLLAVIWGSSFILMKKSLEVYSYEQVAALRLFIAFLSLIPFLFIAFRKVKRKHWPFLFLTALLGNGFPAFLFSKAQTQLDSGFTGILNSLTPLFTLFLGVLFFSLRLRRINIIGILIGFIGAVYLSTSILNREVVINNYVLYIILATFLYAVSINVIKYYLLELDSLSITSLAFLFLGPFMGFYIFNTDFIELTQTPEGLKALIYILILALVGTSFAVVLFNYLLKRSSVVFASSVTYLIPIVAILWGFIDGEQIIIKHLLATILIFLGIYLVNKKEVNSE